MYLADISNLSPFSAFRVSKKPSVPKKFDLVSRCFDESLLRRLKALGPPSISLSWISRAFDLLSFTHAEARSLISNLKSSSLDDEDDDSLDLYLGDSVKILDLCNSVSSRVEKLRQVRLLVNFFLESVNCSEKLRRARDSLAAWESSSLSTERHSFQSNIDLDIDLAAGIGIGKISSVGRLIRRTIHAVELVTAFVAGATASALSGSPDLGSVSIRAPAEFSWSESFNDLVSAFSAELNRRFTMEKKRKAVLDELDDVERRVRAVCDVIDDVDAEERKEKLNDAVEKLETATETLKKGLDGLANGVNVTFHTVLCIRNDVLTNLRLGKTTTNHRKQNNRPKAIQAVTFL